MKKYLTISALILLLALVSIAPASAASGFYSVSVKPYDTGTSSLLSASKLDIMKEYSLNKPSVSSYSLLNPGKSSALIGAQTNGFSSSKGTASAFITAKQLQQDEDGNSMAMEFSQKVSITGDISTFEFFATYY
jgi:hypothetical protein